MAWENWSKYNDEPQLPEVGGDDENQNYYHGFLAPERKSIANGIKRAGSSALGTLAGGLHGTRASLWDYITGVDSSDAGDSASEAVTNFVQNSDILKPVDYWGERVGTGRQVLDDVLENGANVAANVAGMAAISAIPGVGESAIAGKSLMALNAFSQVYGDTYNNLVAQGVDPDIASENAAYDALLQAPMEFIGYHGLLGKLGQLGKPGQAAQQALMKLSKNNKYVAKILGGAVTEAPTEFLQEYPDEYFTNRALGKDTDWGEATKNAAYSAAIGGILGGIGGGLSAKFGGNTDNSESLEGQNDTPSVDNEPTSIDTENTYNGTGTNRPTYTRESAPNPAMYVMSRLVGSGIDEQTAAGIVGGLMQESGGNTADLSTTAENSSGAYGIAQWLDRRGALEAFAKERSTDPSDLDTQIDFLIHELQGSEGEALSKIKGAKSVEEAGVLADQYYERSEGTDEIRSQKSKNARAIYDAYVNGGSPVSGNIPNMNNANNEKPPKSAEEFLRDQSEAEVATNASGNTDISKINEINDVLKNGSKQDAENLARKLGWMGYDNKVVSDTPQTTGLPTSQSNGQNAQETPNNASTTIQKQAPVVQKQVPVQQPKPITVPNKNLKNISEKKAEPLPGDTGIFSRNAEKPKEQEGGIVPQPTSSSFPRESLGIYNRDVQGQAPSKPVLPQRDNPNSISQNRPSYGNANRQVGIKVNPQTIKNGLKNKYLRNLVKQAFVDGNREAMDRLSAYKVKAPVLEAVKEDVIPNYRKVTPQEQQTVQPQSDTYTPTYRNREDLNRGMTEGQRNRDTGYVPEANEGAPISRQWKTPQEAMEAGRLVDANTNAYESEPTERNKKADKDLKSRIRQEKKDERNAEKSAKAKEKAQKAEEAKAKREAKQAEEEHRRRVKGDGYTPIYRNRSDIDSHYRNSSTNKSDEVDVSGGNGSIESKRASSPSEAMKADNRESANTNHYSTEKVKRDKKADEDLKSRIRQEESERKTRETREKEEPIHEEKKPQKEDYHIRYGNKKEAMGHLKDTSDNSKKDVSVNGSDRSIPTKWRTPQEAMEGMRRQGETAINREANKDTHTTTKQERNAEADKNLKEKIQKEKTNESTNNKPQVRELLHRPEENKGINTKSQQTGKQEGTTSEAGKEKQGTVREGDTVTVKGEPGTYTVDVVINKNGTNKPALIIVRGINHHVKPEDVTVVMKSISTGEYKKSAFELAPEYKKKANELQEQFDNGEITADELRDKLQKLAKEFNENVKGKLSAVEEGLVRDTNNHIADLKENAEYESNPDKATYEESVELATNMANGDGFDGTLEEAWVELTDSLRETGAAPAEGVWKNPFKGDKLQKGIYNREVARFRKKEAQKARYQKGKKVAKDLYENTKKEIQNVLDGYRKGKGNKDVAGKAITAWRNKLTKDLSENSDTKGLKFKDLEKDLNDFIKSKREELQNAKRGEKVETAPLKSLEDGKKEIDDVFNRYMNGTLGGSKIKAYREIQAISNKTVDLYMNSLGLNEMERISKRMEDEAVSKFINYATSKISEIRKFKKEEKEFSIDDIPWLPSRNSPKVKELEGNLYRLVKAVENGTMPLPHVIKQIDLYGDYIKKTSDKELQKLLSDVFVNYKFKVYQTYFSKFPEIRRASSDKEIELSSREIAERAKSKETKKTIYEDTRALQLLGKDLYETAYKPIVDYLRIIGRKPRGHAFESAVLYSKLVNSFYKNYGIKFEKPSLLYEKKHTEKRGSQIIETLGMYNSANHSFILNPSSDGLTFMHEATHMYIAMLKRFSSLTDEEVELYFGKDATRAKKAIESIRQDINHIDEWAKYSKEHLAEYDGTDLDVEFAVHALKVEDGTDIGEEIWKEERIARGMEQYLGEGIAPNKELKNIFEKFKQWFVDAYLALSKISNKPLPEDVRKFYDSMITGDRSYFVDMAKEKNSGKSTTVRTDDGKEFKTTYKIIPADSLVSSSTYDFAKNESYPSELQPRDRDRVSMREQVDDMARNLSPQDLAESRNVNEGAPLINQDNVVENGNGRTMAITRAYKHGGEAYTASAKAYKQFLMDNAEKFGYTKEQVEAMENPVLVRQRDSSSDNLQDSIIHSTNGGMKMSASQQAQADVKKLTAKTLAKYNYDGSGDLTLESNRDFVTSVLNEVSDKSDRDVLFDKDGKPSKAGIERVRAVMTAAAYGNTELLDRMSESTDNDMQNVIKAYVSVAPRVASVRMRMVNGEIGKGYNLPKVLSDALDFYFKCKAENKPVKFALNETGLFSDGKVTLPNEAVGDFVRFMDDNVRKPRKISDSIEQMVKYVDGANEGSMSLMPEAQMNLSEIVGLSTEEMNQLVPVDKDGKYLVTNRNIIASDPVHIVDITNAVRTRVGNKNKTEALLNSLVGQTIEFVGGKGFVSRKDKKAISKVENPNTGKQLIHSHDTDPGIFNSKERNRALTMLDELLHHGVYVDKHPDSAHGTNTKYIEIFVPVRDGNNLYTFRISARERGNSASVYEVGNALFYNMKKERDLTMRPSKGQKASNKSLSTVTIAEMLGGVNDRNKVPYVINGKLNYDDNIFLTNNMLSDEQTTHHSVEEMKAQTMSNFPNAKNVEDTGTHLSFDLPNGEHVEADFTNDTISVNRVKAQQDYGGTLKGDEKALGKLETAGREAFMTLSLDNVDETPSHEAMHLAMKFLSDRERNALFKLYKNEEAICEAYRKWRIARKARQGALLGKIFQKISDFANKVLFLFRENDKNIFRKVSEGQVWERPINNEAAKHVSYMMDLSHVQEEFEQKYIEEAKDKVKTAIKGKNYNNDHITVKERPKDNDWSVKEKILNNTFSPSRTTDPVMKRLYELADTATRLQQKLKTQWTEHLAMARKLIKTDDQKKSINALLWAEDAEQHVYTDEEMRAQGIDEDVIKAHNIIRRLLAKVYKNINDTYTRATIKSKVFSSREDAEARVREAQASPYEEVIGEIRQVNQGGNIGYQVSIKSPHSVKHLKEEMTADEFKALKADKYNVVTSVTKLSDGNYSISWKSYAKPLTNMEGYMPHFFHDFMIIRKGADGKAEVVGSATSLEKAVAKAEEMHDKDGGDFLISPKAFQFDGELGNPVLMADKDYRKLMNNITMNSTMSLKDAQAITQARMKGRHAFLGELKKRKGAEGFEDNAIWAIQHHIDASARYCALDPFKVKAINLFERAYGDSKKDYGRGTKQAFAKGYIESMMGKPTEGELFVNKILRHVPGLKNTNRPAKLLTGMLAHTTGVLKLGASPAAGFVNLMQIFNANGYLGSRRVAVGIKRAMHPTMADLRILKALGVDEEVGLADSDFGKVRLEDSKLGRIADRYTKLADKLMLPFSTAEKTIRRATVLAAYYKYMEEHQGETDIATLKKRAGNYAMEINRKVNFDYSTADAPRIFRAVQGTVIGDLALQFQKYGVKELEVIGDFLPYFGKQTTTKQKLEFFGYYLAVAGMWNAFPFQDLLMSILGWMFDDDPEKMAKKAMMEWAGNDPMSKALVNVANYGAGSLVGMDISQRVGLKGVVPEVSGGGPLASTTIGLAKAIINGDTNGAMKSISPALGNVYGAVAGYNTDSKGRKTVDYDGWDRAMRFLGFRTVKEATATDAQNIIYNYKDQKKNAREKAKSEYFKNPSSDNIKKLKDLGYTDKQIKDFKDNKNSTRVERAQSGLSKDDMKKLKPVFDYAN